MLKGRLVTTNHPNAHKTPILCFSHYIENVCCKFIYKENIENFSVKLCTLMKIILANAIWLNVLKLCFLIISFKGSKFYYIID